METVNVRPSCNFNSLTSAFFREVSQLTPKKSDGLCRKYQLQFFMGLFGRKQKSAKCDGNFRVNNSKTGCSFPLRIPSCDIFYIFPPNYPINASRILSVQAKVSYKIQYLPPDHDRLYSPYLAISCTGVFT